MGLQSYRTINVRMTEELRDGDRCYETKRGKNRL